MFNANDVLNVQTENQTPACDYSRLRSAFCDVTFMRQTYASGLDSKEYTWYS